MNGYINGYYDLAAAIVLQAMKDYKRALKAIRDGKTDIRYFKRKRECERFFRSKYGKMLSCDNAERIIEKCRREVEEETEEEVI